MTVIGVMYVGYIDEPYIYFIKRLNQCMFENGWEAIAMPAACLRMGTDIQQNFHARVA